MNARCSCQNQKICNKIEICVLLIPKWRYMQAFKYEKVIENTPKKPLRGSEIEFFVEWKINKNKLRRWIVSCVILLRHRRYKFWNFVCLSLNGRVKQHTKISTLYKSTSFILTNWIWINWILNVRMDVNEEREGNDRKWMDGEEGGNMMKMKLRSHTVASNLNGLLSAPPWKWMMMKTTRKSNWVCRISLPQLCSGWMELNDHHHRIVLFWIYLKFFAGVQHKNNKREQREKENNPLRNSIW